MEHICQHCRALLSSGIRSPYHLSISQLSNSELIKCDLCEAYLLREQGNTELLQAHSFTPSARDRTPGRIESSSLTHRH